jgi:hypothetical protein
MQGGLEPRLDGAPPVALHTHVHMPFPKPNVMAGGDPNDGRPAERRRRQPRPRGRVGYWFARAVAVAWEIGGLALLGFLNVMVLSRGLIELSQSLFGAKMSAMPGFGFMAGYQVWNKVLVGHVIALGFFCFMAFAWKLVVRDLVLARGNELIDASEWNLKNSRLFWRIGCGVLMACDGILFFYGVTQSNLWSRTTTPYFAALVSTLMYLAIVAVYSFGCLYLWDWERSDS